MNFKKYIALFLFLGLMPFACFEPKKHYVIYDMALQAYKDELSTKPIKITDTLTNDSVFLELKLSTYFMAQQLNFNLSNSCYATTKPRPGYLGFKDPLKNITLTSDNKIFGRAAGEDLGDIIKWIKYKGPKSEESLKELHLFKDQLNAISPAAYPKEEALEYLYFTQRPGSGDALNHRFDLVFEYESGHKHIVYIFLNWK